MLTRCGEQAGGLVSGCELNIICVVEGFNLFNPPYRTPAVDSSLACRQTKKTYSSSGSQSVVPLTTRTVCQAKICRRERVCLKRRRKTSRIYSRVIRRNRDTPSLRDTQKNEWGIADIVLTLKLFKKNQTLEWKEFQCVTGSCLCTHTVRILERTVCMCACAA